jgi:hypothetical protein
MRAALSGPPTGNPQNESARMKTRSLGIGLIVLVTVFLLSCGGGGGGGGGVGVGLGATAASGQAADAGVGTGSNGTAAGAGGVAGAAGSSAASGDSAGTGANAGAGTSVSGGGDDSGVGSGGTGISTSDAVGIGGINGLGSVILNDVRYDVTTAVVDLQDASTLEIGMTARVAGSVSADFSSGVAQQIASAADLRGPVQAINGSAASFAVMGTTVTTDSSTVWGNLAGLSSLAPGAVVQVWGLPGTPGNLAATRVEITTTPGSIVTGTVQNLDASSGTFMLGGIVVSYGAATVPVAALANGAIVRVRASGVSFGTSLVAAQVQPWYALPAANNGPASLAGVVTNYAGLGSFRILGTQINASNAQLTGGPAGSIGNGVRVVVDGTLVNGVVVASKLKIMKVPGTGGPSSFSVIGTVGDFVSVSSFRVRGQPINAGGPGVQFINGTSANLGNGTKVTISGDQVVNGVLQADLVQFN